MFSSTSSSSSSRGLWVDSRSIDIPKSASEFAETFISSHHVFLLSSAILVFYIFFGVAVYGGLMEWSFTDCVYFVTITLTTVGFGDLIPSKDSARIFTCFYLFFGVGILGTCLGLLLGSFLDENEAKIQKRMSKVAAKFRVLKARVREFKEQISMSLSPSQHKEVLESISKDGGDNPFGESKLNDDLEFGSSSTSSFADRISSVGIKVSEKREDVGSSSMTSQLLDEERGINVFGDFDLNTPEGRFNRELHLLKVKMFISVVEISLCVFAGTFFMMSYSNYGFPEALYFSVATITTVGYGDVVPDDNGSKWFTIFFAIVGTIIVGKSLSDIVQFPLIYRTKKAEMAVLDQYSGEFTAKQMSGILTSEIAQVLDPSPNKKMITKAEFVLSMLHLMGKLDMNAFEHSIRCFDNLDKDSSGFLNEQDIDGLMRLSEFHGFQQAEETKGPTSFPRSITVT